MYKIVEKKVLNPTVVQLQIEAPLVANKAEPGQFIILRVDENGERIPLTVAGTDKAKGTVKIIFPIVGGSFSVVAPTIWKRASTSRTSADLWVSLHIWTASRRYVALAAVSAVLLQCLLQRSSMRWALKSPALSASVIRIC